MLVILVDLTRNPRPDILHIAEAIIAVVAYAGANAIY